MSEKTKAKSKISGRMMLAGLVGVGLLAFGVGWAASWLQSSDKQSKAEVAGLPDALLTAGQAKVQNFANQGNYAEAQKAAAEALAKTTDKSEQYVLYMQQGNAYESAQQYADALAAYQQAKTLNPNYTSVFSVGRVAEAMGDKSLALENYKQALQLLQPGMFYESNKYMVEERMKAVGG